MRASHDIVDARLGDEVLAVVGHLFLAVRQLGHLLTVGNDGDMMIRTIHARPHQVGHAGVPNPPESAQFPLDC